MIKDITTYQFFKKLQSLNFIETIFLFGSRAQGTAQKQSDIDLAIECPKATRDQWHEVLRIINEADTLLEIDCIRLDTVTDQAFLTEINKNKIVLFTRKNS